MTLLYFLQVAHAFVPPPPPPQGSAKTALAEAISTTAAKTTLMIDFIKYLQEV
jgi:hypothetical protein